MINQSVPIPTGIYFSEGNFYSIVGHHGQGEAFYCKWFYRRAEFPGDPRIDDQPTADEIIGNINRVFDDIKRDGMIEYLEQIKALVPQPHTTMLTEIIQFIRTH